MVTLRFLDINKLQSAMITFVFPLLITVSLFTSANCYISSASQSLRGSTIKCENEGEIVNVSLLSDDPCITCKCKNKEIVCQREICPNFKSCYLLNYGKNRTCCDICKGCWYNNHLYKSGETFVDSKDICKNFICNAGVITEYTPHCHVTCKNPVKVEGQCCPSCGQCEIEGKIYKEGEIIPSNLDDPCIVCKCTQGNMICTKSSCPVLACPQSKWIKSKNECCPTCKGHRKVKDFEENCIMGLATYQNGQSYILDHCTECTCNQSTNICKRKVCPPLECPPAFYISEPDECCPRCQGAQEARSSCKFANQEYKNGEHWKMDNCHKCSCKNGEIRCVAELCSKDLVCPTNYKQVRLQGECCNSCVEDHSICKITNNLTSYRTFDGKTYHFKSQCNYILSRDCEEKSFSVNLINRNHHNNLTDDAINVISILNHSAIMIRIEETKVRFGNFGTVRVGREKVRLPHIKLGTLSIIQDGQKITLRANIGIKVVWEYGKTLEITVPPKFKSKICGLCGNYNGDKDDDFMTKRSRTVSELELFTASWKIGKTMVCEENPTSTASLKLSKNLTCTNNWERQIHAMNVCKILKSPLFSACHHMIRINSYFGKCMRDVCSCQNENCHCNAIQSYANQCRIFGINNPNWRKSILCEARKCPKGAIFKICSSPCKLTCKNYKRPRHCNKICQPGCDCPYGKVWHNNKCVDPEQCLLPIT